MTIPHYRTATAVLQSWLASLQEATLNQDVGIGLVEGLALGHRAAVKRLLDDIEVQEAIDRVCERGSHHVPLEDKLDAIKSMLVDACWMQSFMAPPQRARQRTSTSQDLVTRTEKIRRLMRAAEKAQKLAEEIVSLSGLTGHNLTVSHLQGRLAAEDKQWFIKRRKGWPPRSRHADRSVADLLEMLTSELVEEAALIKISIDKTAQPGHRRHHLEPLIDTLSRQSVKLGNRTAAGLPCPDFQLVHAVLTSVMPDQAPDESTLRKGWTRKGKLKAKSP